MNKNTAFAAEAEQMDHVRTVIDSMTADMRDHPDPRLAMESHAGGCCKSGVRGGRDALVLPSL